MMIGGRVDTDRGRYGFGMVTAWVVLAMILLFAGLSVALIALGGQAYRAIQNTADQNAHRRASVGYVTGKIHALDCRDAVRVERMMLNGTETDVLILGEIIDGETYETRIYCSNQVLREQFVSADTALESADDGEEIAKLQSFEVELDSGMLTMRYVDLNGWVDTVYAALHS